MGDAFGKYGRILLQICVLVNNIGVLIVYMIIIGITSLVTPVHQLIYQLLVFVSCMCLEEVFAYVDCYFFAF